MNRENFGMLSFKYKGGIVTGDYKIGDSNTYSIVGNKDKVPHPDLVNSIDMFKSTFAYLLNVKEERVNASGIKVKTKTNKEEGTKIFFSISGTLKVYKEKTVGLSTPEFDLEEENDKAAGATLKNGDEYEILEPEDAIEKLETEFYKYIIGEKEAQGNLFNKKETE
ncbi:MAG: hypothetical protein ACLFT4_05490 [Bacteroidales bacterium]